MFQLIKSIADFPNMIYVVPFDKDIVVRALAEVQKGDGEEYLKKIVQVPISIPPIKEADIRRLLEEEMLSFVDDKAKGEWKTKYGEKMIDNCFLHILKNIRDIKSLKNTVIFKYGTLKDETNFVDLVATALLEIKFPKVVEWIFDNHSILMGRILYDTEIDKLKNGEEENEINYTDVFKKMYDEFGTYLEEMISIMFWRLRYSSKKHYNNSSEYPKTKEMRIGKGGRFFSLYFSHSLHEVSIPQADIVKFVSKMDKKGQMKIINELKNAEELAYLIAEIFNYIDDIDDIDDIVNERIDLFIDLTFELIEKTEIELLTCRNLLVNLLMKFSRKDRNKKMKQKIEVAEIQHLTIIASILVNENYLHELIEKSDLLSSEQQQVEELKKLFFSKLEKLLQSTSLFKVRHFEEIVRYWKDNDSEKCEKYLKENLHNSFNIINYITNIYVRSGIGINGALYEASDDYIKYFTQEQAVLAIDEFLKEPNFKLLSKHEFYKAIAFYLHTKRNNNDEDVSKIEVENYIQKNRLFYE